MKKVNIYKILFVLFFIPYIVVLIKAIYNGFVGVEELDSVIFSGLVAPWLGEHQPYIIYGFEAFKQTIMVHSMDAIVIVSIIYQITYIIVSILKKHKRENGIFHVLNLIGIFLWWFIDEAFIRDFDAELIFRIVFPFLFLGVVSYTVNVKKIKVDYGKLTFKTFMYIGILLASMMFTYSIVLGMTGQRFDLGGTWISLDLEWWTALIVGLIYLIFCLIIGFGCRVYIWVVTKISRKYKNKKENIEEIKDVSEIKL